MSTCPACLIPLLCFAVALASSFLSGVSARRAERARILGIMYAVLEGAIARPMVEVALLVDIVRKLERQR